MFFSIPNFADPTRATPVTAYAKTNGITINVADNRAQVDVLVWASKDDYVAGASPIDTVHVRFGSDGVPDLTTFIASNLAAWANVQTALASAATQHPALAGATPA